MVKLTGQKLIVQKIKQKKKRKKRKRKENVLNYVVAPAEAPWMTYSAATWIWLLLQYFF